jgi:hypothetical protein
VTITYDLNEDDMVAWHRYWLRTSTVARRSRVWRGVQVFAAFCFSVAFVFTHFPVFWASLVSGALVVALIIFIWRGLDELILKQLRANASDPQLRGSFGRIRLTLSDEGVRELTPAAESFAKWDSVTEVSGSEGRIFIRLNNGAAAIISKISYSGPVPFDELQGVIVEHRKKFASNHLSEPTLASGTAPAGQDPRLR